MVCVEFPVVPVLASVDPAVGGHFANEFVSEEVVKPFSEPVSGGDEGMAVDDF